MPLKGKNPIVCIKCGQFLGFGEPGELVTATCEECMLMTPREARDYLVNRTSKKRSEPTDELPPVAAPFEAALGLALRNLLIAGVASAGFVAGAVCFYLFIYAPYQRKNAARSDNLTSQMALLREECSSTSRFARAQYFVEGLEGLEASRRKSFVVHRVASMYKPASIPSLKDVAESAEECNARIAPRLNELDLRLRRLMAGQ